MKHRHTLHAAVLAIVIGLACIAAGITIQQHPGTTVATAAGLLATIVLAVAGPVLADRIAALWRRLLLEREVARFRAALRQMDGAR